MVMFLTGVFYTVSKFKEMSEEPTRYTKSDAKLIVEELCGSGFCLGKRFSQSRNFPVTPSSYNVPIPAIVL